MDSKDFQKAREQLAKGYKRQLQDLVLQGLVFFDYDYVQTIIQEVFDAASDNSSEDVPTEEDNLPF